MSTLLEDLAAEAKKLPPEARARLADLLVESLDQADFGPVDHEWIAVARQRRDEVRTGAVEPIPGEIALQSVRDLLGQ
ncbi:MAG: addiction module protein [Chloroflexota bacterium]